MMRWISIGNMVNTSEFGLSHKIALFFVLSHLTFQSKFIATDQEALIYIFFMQ